MNLTLVILAAGLSSRFGGVKQLEGVGPSGEALLDYAIYDAIRAGYSDIVLVIREVLEQDFREHLRRIFGDSLPVSYVVQRLEALPPGYSLPGGRTKPWGTAHAVLTAEPEVKNPFVAMNADDFYGATAFASLAEYLRGHNDSQVPDFAAAGYTLRDTLSASGGVSRAICELDGAGFLERVTELKQIQKRGDSLAGVTLAGDRYDLTGDETISMNLWAATPLAFPLLQQQFIRFLDEHGDDFDAEFLLSKAVNNLIYSGEARIKVIPAPGPWLGITFPDDRAVVAARLMELIDAGAYPHDLSSR